ncbi:unnamed protein product [Vitrella brassicaformis CCMP3155]|uniref:Protein-lysine N-methyltransferase Vbra_14903 n=2 Tax=Vitrella brassicaformis TaxID=1169539 RepID=A0A0G4FC47_VITBC|nr:unnamed protein product [Vitrella brassicaformis CCMP3155]|mmetsp:Transcript_36935/g.92629  ORF Transcript_36935/g.92629 Transcript_36935/m.92629 type:complete len:239 (+) Transcript_36935:663-1379(+)|eukprot:CEM10201.1 unnamed protein product [Vitrella brassicaformis CCMP3155]
MASDSSASPPRSPSLLTKEAYWSSFYTDEQHTYESSGNEGEEWFEGQVDNIVEWLVNDLIGPSRAPTLSVLDVGMGNGLFLARLVDEGFTNLHGIDYAESAVQFARRLMEDRRGDWPDGVSVRFDRLDVLACEEELRAVLREGGYSLVHDKGTFDVMWMRGQAGDDSAIEGYLRFLDCAVAAEGLFVVTSCNCTDEELQATFGGSFEHVSSLAHPSLAFGGQTGQVVSTVAFKRRQTD